jgi:hypothetical protein
MFSGLDIFSNGMISLTQHRFNAMADTSEKSG